MFPEVFHLGCTKWAVGTGKRLLSSMDACMLLQVGDDGSCVGTVWALVDLDGCSSHRGGGDGGSSTGEGHGLCSDTLP